MSAIDSVRSYCKRTTFNGDGTPQVLPAEIRLYPTERERLKVCRCLARKVINERGVIFKDHHSLVASMKRVLDDSHVRPVASPCAGSLTPPLWMLDDPSVDGINRLDTPEREVGRHSRHEISEAIFSPCQRDDADAIKDHCFPLALRQASLTSIEAAVSDHGMMDFRLPCSRFITARISARPSSDSHQSAPSLSILFAIALQEQVGDDVTPSQSLSNSFNSEPGPDRR
jgi:hypothetical protein